MRASLIAAVVVVCSATAAAGQPPSGQPGPERAYLRFDHVRLVAVDPGHGGKNRGCLGADGTFEKHVALAISKRLARILTEETDAAALLTRRDDRHLGLRERTRLANRWDADVFLSIHLNADEFGRGFGVETWFLSVGPDSEEADRMAALEEAEYGLASDLDAFERDSIRAVVRDTAEGKAQADSEALGIGVARALTKATGAKLRGVKQARFTVLQDAHMPAIVVEVGFLTHREEGAKLVRPDYQERVARAIVDGLLAYDRSIGGTRQAAAGLR